MKRQCHRTPALWSCLAFALLAAVGLSAQDLAYDSGSDGSDGAFALPAPFTSGIENVAIAFDPIRGELIVFGGSFSENVSATATDEMWVFDGSAWTEKTPAARPPARFAAGMVWDSVREEIVLFGGRNGNTILGDTWTWDGTAWTQENPAASPPARWDHAMAFDDARGEAVVFGGGIGTPVTDDTWTWNGTNWTQEAPASKPSARFQCRMAYDSARQETVLFGGRSGGTILSDTWIWDGSDWSQRMPVVSPPARIAPGMAYHAVLQRVVLFGGSASSFIGNANALGDTWLWDGANWSQDSQGPALPATAFAAAAYDASAEKVFLFGGEGNSDALRNSLFAYDAEGWESVSGSDFIFDMAGRPSGVWQFTSIDIPAGTRILFRKNAANTGVIWLASGPVNIAGEINLDGADGGTQTNDGVKGAPGGPGGFRGGVGGIRQDLSGTLAAQPGLGPGGGAAGVNGSENGQPGRYAGVYGNPLIDPLVGGSGGGGEASTTTGNGRNGGGGGGAILVASSRDITVDGRISALGGVSVSNQGGFGSGGAIALIADRLLGSGVLDASGPGGEGRVRLEGFERPLAAGSVTQPVGGAPFEGRDLSNAPRLVVASVDGVGAPAEPTGTFFAPDVSFSDTNPVQIVVNAVNVPDGTPVRLRLTAPGSVTETAEQTLAGGTATFAATLPPGIGSIQAIAEF